MNNGTGAKLYTVAARVTLQKAVIEVWANSLEEAKDQIAANRFSTVEWGRGELVRWEVTGEVKESGE